MCISDILSIAFDHGFHYGKCFKEVFAKLRLAIWLETSYPLIDLEKNIINFIEIMFCLQCLPTSFITFSPKLKNTRSPCSIPDYKGSVWISFVGEFFGKPTLDIWHGLQILGTSMPAQNILGAKNSAILMNLMQW